MSKRNRLLAFAMAGVVLFSLLFSSCYIALNANHHCTGEHCQICTRISMCEDTLKSFSFTGAMGVFGALAVYFLVRLISLFSDYSFSESLITLKVKLSN